MVSALFLIALCLTSASRAADGPTIQGWLRSEDGMPVSGGIYVWQRNPPCWQNHPFGGWHCDLPRSYSAVADAEGRFETKEVVPDDYYLSFSAGTELLDSNWLGVYELSVRDGKSVRDLVITLRRAATLIVRVNDPLGLLPAQGTQASGNRLIVGVDATPGGFHGASTRPRDALGGFDYRLNIRLVRKIRG